MEDDKHNNMNSFKVSIIIPAYNEEENLQLIYEKVKGMVLKYPEYEILFVDDGSTDKTLQVIKTLAAENKKVKYISFSRNFGHQNALKAGIDHASGDCVISLDADLQHPPELIDEMIGKWKEGYHIVYTVRDDKINIPFFKRVTSVLFYKIINLLSDLHLDLGTADFRLLDKEVVNVLKNLKESFLFLRGIINWIGFKKYSITYIPSFRTKGVSKYSISKMIGFALNGITGFSVKPLRIATVLGLLISFTSAIYGLYAIGIKIFADNAVSGWASLLVSVLFIGGIQLLMLGIIGEYIGKLFIEVKSRPNYIIQNKNIE